MLVFLAILFLCSLIFFTKHFFLEIAIVKGGSMYPTIQEGDLLVVKKFGYSISKNDIVLLKTALTPGVEEYAVKRIIATGGDTVEIDYENNLVYVNNQIIDEPYINYNQDDPMQRSGKSSNVFFYVPDGYVFLLGDNRNYSVDSRDERMGAISVNDVIGIVNILLPTNPY